ncbi:taurine catabolism dioxygenase [Lindgomyces ingoldianus]|uniref:Taurine catabolism dioxygenase n=1 Tax=Lindgomyces ingoldianus TaxID=673940 RepID=A0ACB6R474_9PLEO|nr:taurine catabolism dioxygenase [Lindgomyces ingoldianus]KAF2474093.1 taurine catabolism dioxygenase [Lindgomyces ingoldianus]
MPGVLIQDTPFKMITVKELHPSYAAEVIGADFMDMSDEQLREIKAAMAKYGVLVFRNTGMTDDEHVVFSSKIGELDNVKRYLTSGRKLRYKHFELFDAGNVDEDGNPIHPDAPRSHYNRGNALFHVDSSFNPRRASWSLLRAVELPPPGMGGETEFADSRTAWDELDESLKKELLEKDYIGAHTLLHSRKSGSPEYFKDLDPTSQPMTRHKLVQTHEPSGRTNLYIAAHCHHLETAEGPIPGDESNALLKKLMDHVTQPKYVLSVDWFNESDMVAWDNTCVMHRATGGSFEGKFRRDMRRTTVHDDSTTAWGLNAGQEARGFNLQKVMGEGKVEDISVSASVMKASA